MRGSGIFYKRQTKLVLQFILPRISTSSIMQMKYRGFCSSHFLAGGSRYGGPQLLSPPTPPVLLHMCFARSAGSSIILSSNRHHMPSIGCVDSGTVAIVPRWSRDVVVSKTECIAMPIQRRCVILSCNKTSSSGSYISIPIYISAICTVRSRSPNFSSVALVTKSWSKGSNHVVMVVKNED
jgi:hypothetical protein